MRRPLSILTKTLLIKQLICGQTGKKVAIITRDKNYSCDKKFSFSGCLKPSLSLSEEIGNQDCKVNRGSHLKKKKKAQ